MADWGVMPPWVWWVMACLALWLLYRIYEMVKAIHSMLHDEWQRKRDQKWNDELSRSARGDPD